MSSIAETLNQAKDHLSAGQLPAAEGALRAVLQVDSTHAEAHYLLGVALVELGQVGRIAMSQQRVLSFDVIDLKTSRPITADQFASAMDMDEVRFRGNTLGRYRSGEWSSGVQNRDSDFSGILRGLDPYRFIPKSDFSVAMTFDPPVGRYVFAPYPVSKINGTGAAEIYVHSISSGMVFRERSQSDRPRTFNIECPKVSPNSDLRPTFSYWSLPIGGPESFIQSRRQFINQRAFDIYVNPALEEDLPQLYGVARQVGSETNQSGSRNRRLLPEEKRLAAVLKYLSSENGFVYTTNQTRRDRSIDPVEDFLFNTKSGHCEYFASACTLMLQSVELPARMVNGYYGSEVNSVSGHNEIRQKHAHTWVEVFINNRWETVDPTPAAPRRELISSGDTGSLVSNLQTAISDLWNDGIHKMSAERQKEFFAPVISTSKSMLDTIRKKGILETVWNGIVSFISTPDAWFSWRGGVATFMLLLFGGLISRLHPIAKLMSLFQSVMEQFSGKQRARKSVIRFYAQFCALCEQHGMPISASESALENSRAAINRFGAQLDSADLQNLPIRIASAFNAVRFGKAELTDEQAASIGKDLTFFANALSSVQTSKT